MVLARKGNIADQPPYAIHEKVCTHVPEVSSNEEIFANETESSGEEVDRVDLMIRRQTVLQMRPVTFLNPRE